MELFKYIGLLVAYYKILTLLRLNHPIKDWTGGSASPRVSPDPWKTRNICHCFRNSNHDPLVT
jgi:hypothetical protein